MPPPTLPADMAALRQLCCPDESLESINAAWERCPPERRLMGLSTFRASNFLPALANFNDHLLSKRFEDASALLKHFTQLVHSLDIYRMALWPVATSTDPWTRARCDRNLGIVDLDPFWGGPAANAHDAVFKLGQSFMFNFLERTDRAAYEQLRVSERKPGPPKPGDLTSVNFDPDALFRGYPCAVEFFRTYPFPPISQLFAELRVEVSTLPPLTQPAVEGQVRKAETHLQETAAATPALACAGADPEKAVELNSTMKAIISVCCRKALKGEAIARHQKVDLSYGGHIRRLLAKLVKAGLLQNTEDGYRATTKGKDAVAV